MQLSVDDEVGGLMIRGYISGKLDKTDSTFAYNIFVK